MMTIKRLVTLAAAICAAGSLFAYTEIEDGIQWTYRVIDRLIDGKAEIFNSRYLSAAIPSSTTGAITIPSTLGGTIGWLHGIFFSQLRMCCFGIAEIHGLGR